MKTYEIWLDGTSNEYIGVKLQNAPVLSAATPKYTTVSVPGRNGALHVYDGTYESRSLTADAYVYRRDFVKNAFGKVHEWLFGSLGLRKIITSDDREHFYRGILANGAVVSTILDKMAPFSLKFECQPQRFLIIGEESITINSSTDIYNPTVFSAKPYIKVYGNGDGSIRVGENTAFLYNIDEYLCIDAETDNAYKGNINKNNDIQMPSSLLLKSGETNISFSGNIEKIEIIPRWWEL